MSNLDDIKNQLEGLSGGKGKAVAKIPKNHSDKNGKVDRRKFNKRDPKSGRKPNEAKLIERGIKSEINKYSMENVQMEVQDPKTGQKRMVKKPRIMWILETYFNVGMKLLAENKDLAAAGVLNSFLDRAMGKAAQPIRGEGEDDAPIRIAGDIGLILKKAYGNNTQEED